MKIAPSFSVQQLLTGLLALGGVTLGVIGFDAERLIGAVDDLKGAQAADHLQIVTNTNGIAGLVPRVDGLEIKYADLDHRVIKLEPR